MREKKRQRGRPKGTESPGYQLNLLRTKAWVWTCNYYLGGTPDAPLSYGALAKNANEYVSSPRDSSYKYTAASFSRWSRGIRYAEIEQTVRDLWPETQGAYRLGPWAEKTPGDKDSECPEGGFVPLWSVIEGQKEEILIAWNEVPKSVWKSWTPYGIIPDNFFKEMNNVVQIFNFANHLMKFKNEISPLLALTAVLTVARFCGDKNIMLYDYDFSFGGKKIMKSLPFAMKPEVIIGLSKLHITVEEIINLCRQNSIDIYDSSALSYDEYFELTGCNRIPWATSIDEEGMNLF